MIAGEQGFIEAVFLLWAWITAVDASVTLLAAFLTFNVGAVFVAGYARKIEAMILLIPIWVGVCAGLIAAFTKIACLAFGAEGRASGFAVLAANHGACTMHFFRNGAGFSAVFARIAIGAASAFGRASGALQAGFDFCAVGVDRAGFAAILAVIAVFASIAGDGGAGVHVAGEDSFAVNVAVIGGIGTDVLALGAPARGLALLSVVMLAFRAFFALSGRLVAACGLDAEIFGICLAGQVAGLAVIAVDAGCAVGGKAGALSAGDDAFAGAGGGAGLRACGPVKAIRAFTKIKIGRAW